MTVRVPHCLCKRAESCWPEITSAAGWYPQVEAAFGAREDRRCRWHGRNSSLEAVRETRVCGLWSQETCLGVLLHPLRGVVSEDQDFCRLQGELQLHGRVRHWSHCQSSRVWDPRYFCNVSSFISSRIFVSGLQWVRYWLVPGWGDAANQKNPCYHGSHLLWQFHPVTSAGGSALKKTRKGERKGEPLENSPTDPGAGESWNRLVIRYIPNSAISGSKNMNILRLLINCCCVVAKSYLTLPPHGLYPAGLLCLWDFPSKNTGVGCHFLLQGNLPDLGMEPTSPALAGRFFTTEQPGKPPFDKKVLLNYSPESFQGCLSKERGKCYVF